MLRQKKPAIGIVLDFAILFILLGTTQASLCPQGFNTSTNIKKESTDIPVHGTQASRSNGIALLTLNQDLFVDRVAQDTWTYLSSDWATDNHLPWSWRSTTITGGDYDNAAEIGLYALSWIGSFEMHRSWSPDWIQVEAEVNAILDQLRVWQTGSQPYQPNGPNAYNKSVFYQWYWISWNPPVVGAGATNHVVPSVDNAWLAMCLITIREYSSVHGHTTMAQKADAILSDMNFRLWYHPETSRFWWGDSEDPQGGGEADYYSNENRIINFVARAMGHLTPTEFRQSLNALVQVEGTYGNMTVQKIAWDGSYFTYAAPALFIHEMGTDYGYNTIMPAAQAQIAYAQIQGYPIWGLSDCYDSNTGGYVQQGAPPAASPNPLEVRPGLVTPHASALALITSLAPQSISNLKNISDTFPTIYDAAYGFRDAVMAKPADPQYGVPSARFSAIAQEWIFLSIVNAQTDFIWNYFYHDAGVRQAHREMYGEKVYLPILTK